MAGYYKDPEATSRVLRDGWLNTGDLGMYTFNDCLKILGRTKDTIVLLNGENIEPIPIEAKLCESELIDQCMVVGQDQKQLAALVVPDLEALQKRGIEAKDMEELAANPEVGKLIMSEARRLITAENGFKSFEHIHAVRLVPKAFEVGDEMTNTFKLKRHVVDQKYEALIQELYHAAERSRR